MGEGWGGGGVSAGTEFLDQCHPHPASPIKGEEEERCSSGEEPTSRRDRSTSNLTIALAPHPEHAPPQPNPPARKRSANMQWSATPCAIASSSTIMPLLWSGRRASGALPSGATPRK